MKKIFSCLLAAAISLGCTAAVQYNPIQSYAVNNDISVSEGEFSYKDFYNQVMESEEWQNCEVRAVRGEMLQPPDDIVRSSDTETLLDAFLDYPFLSDIYCYNDMDYAVKNIFKECGAAVEFAKREDAVPCFLKKCRSIDNIPEEQMGAYMSHSEFRKAVLSILGITENDSTKITDSEAEQIISAIQKDEMGVMSVKEYNIDDAYRICWLQNLMITEYQRNPDFKSLITGEERIMLPAVNNRNFLNDTFRADGTLLQFAKENGVYILQGQRYGNNLIDFNTVTKELVNSIDGNIINIIHTYSNMYYMDIIYIETDTNEYIIPYSEIDYSKYPDCGIITSLITNGSIYTVSDFMDRMYRCFDEKYVIENPDSNGGPPVRTSDDTSYENIETPVGDVNKNGIIDLYDAIYIAESLIGTRTFTDEDMPLADFNGDGTVNLYDIIGIAKYLNENSLND